MARIPKLQRALFSGLGIILSTLQLAMPAGGQKPATQAKKEPDVLRVTTRLVQVSVVAQDKKGEPVTNLTRDDFILLEKGKPQSISFFALEKDQPSATPPKKLPPNVFSNRPEFQSGQPTSATAILLDGLNTHFSDQKYAKDQIIKFLRQLRPNDQVAIYALCGQLRVLHDFTSDIQPLLRSLERYKGYVGRELEASQPAESNGGIDDLDSILQAGDSRASEYYTIDRVQRTLNALEAIANHLSRVPGRKNLIWLSGSFPFSIGYDSIAALENATADRRTFSAEFERTVRAVNSSNLAIYPVDARGLVAQLSTLPDAGRSGASAASGDPSIPAVNLRGSFDTSTRETMQIMAERTGGRAFYDTNDLGGAIRRAVDDSRATYVLGYYPTHTQWDGKFYEIKVDVKRPGVQVRHRRGYFALAEPPRDEKQSQSAMADAVWSPLDATGMGMLVLVEPARIKGQAIIQVKVSLHIEPRGITLEPNNEQWSGVLDVLFVQQNAEGRQVAGLNDKLEMNVKRERYETLKKDGVVLSKHLDIAAGAQKLSVVVRDRPSGVLGSVQVPLSKLQIPVKK